MRTIIFAITFFSFHFLVAQTKNSSDLQFKDGNAADTSISKVFTVVDKMPEFPGGEAALIKWVHDNLIYPDLNDTIEIKSKFLFAFVINEDGSVSNVEVKKGFGIKKYDDEMIKIFQKMPHFKPGMQAGKLVKVAFVLPILIHFSRE